MGRRRRGKIVDGIVLLDKPGGMSSNTALQKVKHLFQAQKAGHTGALDPLASGLLPLCFGQATKVSAYLLDADKTYQVRCRLGERTDTADADGQVVERAAVPELDSAQWQTAANAFLGDIEQVPPMYSALKHEGQRLYKLARAGKEVERPARPVTIHRFELLAADAQELEFLVHCSKGTYIRSLIEDLAVSVGSFAHVTVLRRVAADPFTLEQGSWSLSQLEQMAAADQLEQALLAVDSALPEWPAIQLQADARAFFCSGNPVQAGRLAQPALVKVYDSQDVLLGIGDWRADGSLHPKRLMLNG